MLRSYRVRIRLVTTIFLVGTLILAGCASTQPRQASAPKPDAVGAPAPAPQSAPTVGEARQGGTLNVGLWQEPATLNPYFANMYAVDLVSNLVLEGLLGTDPKGEYYPILASEVPSAQNGGFSADGKTVTFRLKPGLKWADGAPVTSEDIKFTWEAIMNKANPVVSRGGYDLISSIETPNELTAIVTFEKLYASVLTLFPYILPKHLLGHLPDLSRAPFNRQPIGTGPFTTKEWSAGSHIIFERNPNYREVGQPYVDRVVIKIVPSREVGVAQMKSGELDVLWNLSEAQLPEFERMANIDLWVSQSSLSEKLVFNLSANGDPAVPHPILGDQRVRTAIQLAIDKQVIVDKLLFGKAEVGISDIPFGWAANSDLKPVPFDQAKTKELLEAAGWIDQNGDGIREKDGKPLRLSLSTTSGDKLRERVEQVIQEQLKTVGIDIVIENVLPTVLFGSWGDKSPRKLGTYDIQMYSPGPSIDPDQYLFGFYHSSQIPTDANNGAGNNTSRYANPAFDAAVEAASSTVDIAQRKALYGKAAQLMYDDVPVIVLYTRLNINAMRKSVKGWEVNPWEWFSWDLQNWWIE